MKARVCLLFLLLLPVASGFTVNNINLAVHESGLVSVEERILLANDSEEVVLLVPAKAEGVVISMSGVSGPVAYESTDVTDGKLIAFTSPSRGDAVLRYSSRFLTSKSAGQWTLGFRSTATAYRTILRINLPRDTTIVSWSGVSRFSPGPDVLYLYPDEDEINVSVEYDYRGGGGGQLSVWVYALVGLVVVLLVVIVVLRKRGRKGEGPVAEEPAVGGPEAEEPAGEAGPAVETPRERRIKEEVRTMLEEKELRVVELLERADEEITQAQVYRETGIPKASLSDIMKRLERRNVVERTRQGRRNWVKLKEWVFE